MIWRISLGLLFWLAPVAVLADCTRITFDGAPFTVCEAAANTQDIRLFLNDTAGAPLSTFGRVERQLSAQGEKLLFAMNGGMYHEDRSPVGHYMEDGIEKMRVIANAGPGNFGMLPNGIFCVGQKRADVFETKGYVAEKPACTYATQSGPMLVIEGKLHPRFLENSTSRYVRNGVGTNKDGTRAVFAISDAPVTFHHFARLFRDHLKTPNALFLDGNVSRLYDAASGRSDFGRAMGPIIGVVAPSSP